AYVFRHTSDWVEEAKLVASDHAIGDFFSWNAVAVAHDLIAVGALGRKNRRGTAYAFRRDGQQWVEAYRMTSSDGHAGDEYGGGIALTTDSVLVGAGFNEGAGKDSGAAYAYQLLPVASRSSYGQGWPGTLGVPTFTTDQDPVLGSTILLRIDNSLGS